MSDTNKPDAAAFLHQRFAGAETGTPLAPRLTMASQFHLPGDPATGMATYGRSDNPTWDALEEALAYLEGAPALAFPSGMAAVSAAIFSTVRAGDRLVMPSDAYYTPRALSERFLAGLGIAVEFRPTARFAEGGFDGVGMAIFETPSNPALDLVDIGAVTGAIRAAGGVSVVDNTTMTAYGQCPLDLGADIVLASDTKAPGGHSDLLMGHVATRDPDLLAAMRDWRTMTGSIPGPFEAWLLHRSLETLELRFDRMCRSAAQIAPRLAAHPAVAAVRYPGLADHPGHDLSRRQMTRPGFLIGFELRDRETAERFIEDATLIEAATSFGGVHTTAECRVRWGDAVAPGFIRLAVGTEPVEALWAAIEAALPER